AAVVVAGGGDAADVGQCLQHLLGLGPSLQQQVEGALGAKPVGLKEVFAAAAKGGATEEVSGPLAVPGIGGGGPPGPPGFGGVDLIQGEKRRGHAAPSVAVSLGWLAAC